MKQVIVFIFFIGSIGVFSQEITRIEPPFWWANMQNTELQLMCYGQDIASFDVAISKGNLINIRKTENPNYLFITVDTRGLQPGTIDLLFSKHNKKIRKAYELKARKKESRYRKGFDSSDVIYLLMPDRFANGNPENDSQKEMTEKLDRNFDGGRHGGDIQGIINHIDYLKDLGITTVWSTPLLEDNEPVYSYHTYAQSDYYHIDPRYGNNEDYKKLASKLHQNQMKLIMDYVTNHWGSKHWMIQDLPTRDWIHYWNNTTDGFQRSNYRMNTQFDPHASKIDRQDCLNGWFDSTMPDMNLNNPLLRKYMIQNAIWWIEYADLDGLRVDTYSYNDKESMAQWTQAIMDEYPNFNIVGEVWMHNQAQIAYWQKDSEIGAIESYNSHLPSVMDFTLQDAFQTMFNEDKMGWNKGMIRAYDNFTNDFLYPDIQHIMIFMGNHDITRINDYLQGDLNKYKLALSLLLTTRGIPQLYYGDEIGMMGNKERNGDGDLRKDFPGGWHNDPNNAFTASGRNPQQQAYFDFTKKLLHFRKTTPVLHTGKLVQYIPEENVYTYFRYDKNNCVMVILNNSLQKHPIDWKRYTERIRTFTKGVDIISNTAITVGKPLFVNAKQSMIIKFTQ